MTETAEPEETAPPRQEATEGAVTIPKAEYDLLKAKAGAYDTIALIDRAQASLGRYNRTIAQLTAR